MNLQVIALAVLSFHLLQIYNLTSSDQHRCCGGVGVRSDSGSSATQLELCWIDQQECTLNRTEIANIVFCKLLQGVNSLLENYTQWYSTCKELLCVETYINSTNWEIAVCKTFASVLSQCQRTPGNLSVLQNAADPTSVRLTLNWLQPLYNYCIGISCCSAPYDCIDEHPCFENSAQTANVTGLKPSTFYECCVWTLHGDTEGQPMCRCIQTAEAAPDPPTNLTVYQVFPSRRFLLTWRPPAVRNGIIKSYEITISSDRGFNRTNETVDPYLVVDYDPKEGHTYKFQVAARTELGNLSEATELSINPLPQEGMMTLLLLSFAIGLLILILIVVAVVTVTICNRMRKQIKNLTREIQEYEMISKYSAVRHDTGSLPDRYSAIKKRDSNRKQPLYPPPHLAADYLTPTVTKTAGSTEEKGTEEKVKTDEIKDLGSEHKEETKTKETYDKDSEENPYQSLIVSKVDTNTVTIDGYVKVIRSSVGSLEEKETEPPKPPPIPLKTEPDYSLKSSIPQLSLASDLPLRSENMYANRSGTL